MTSLLKISIIFLLALASFPPKAQALDDAIIAVVNNEVITFKDLQDYIRSIYMQMTTEGADEERIKLVMDELKKNGVNKLIEDKLILSEANKVGIEVRAKLIEDRLAGIKERYPSEQAFLEALIKNGGTISDLKKKIDEQYKIKFIIDHEVRSKIFVNPQEVTEFYEKNKDRFMRKEKVNLDSIFIGYKNDTEAARKKAQEAYQKIENGADFLEIAKEYSETSSLGIVEQGELLASIEDVVFKLNDGEISIPLETDRGIYIFRLKGRLPSQIAPLSDAKKDIYNIIYQQKLQDRLFNWIAKLKKRAYIEIKQ